MKIVTKSVAACEAAASAALTRRDFSCRAVDAAYDPRRVDAAADIFNKAPWLLTEEHVALLRILGDSDLMARVEHARANGPTAFSPFDTQDSDVQQLWKFFKFYRERESDRSTRFRARIDWLETRLAALEARQRAGVNDSNIANLVARVNALEAAPRGLVDRGIYCEGNVYERGDVVTWGGSMWIAKERTTSKPDESLGVRAWRLSVKRGRDGKAGKDGRDGRDLQ